MKKRKYQKSEKKDYSYKTLNLKADDTLKEPVITRITEITEAEDKKLLQSASTSMKEMRRILLQIEDGTITFIGQYAKSRKEEALAYLRRTIIEREG